MLNKIKRRFACWFKGFIEHHAGEWDHEKIIVAYRQQGIHIGEGTVIYSSDLDKMAPQLIRIGSNCILTHCTILCHDDSTVVLLRRRLVAPVTIGNNCFVGHGSLILPGVTIGNDCIIGARSVVIKDVPQGSVVAGIPARFIRTTAEQCAKMGEDPRLLDICIQGVCTIPQEAELLRATLARHRPDLL